MVARSGLFVAPAAGPAGTAPTDARLALTGILGPSYQVISGGAITQSGTALTFTVSASVWQILDVTNAAASFLSPTDVTALTGTAGPATGSRIDLMVVKQNNIENGDADSRCNITLVTGTPGAPGVAPAVPLGASLVATITVPAGAANAAASTVVPWAPTVVAPPVRVAQTLAQLNTTHISSLPSGAHATVAADPQNNGDYVWNGAAWQTTGDRYLSCTRAASFSMTTNSTMFILMGSGITATGTSAPLWGAPISHNALTNAAGVYSNEIFQWDSNQGQLTVKANGTYEIEFRASGSPISAGTISIGITKNSVTIGSTANDLARDDRANSSAVAQFLFARNPAVPLVTTDVVRFMSFIFGAPGAVTLANSPMEGTFRIARVGA